jgi:D-beta-D-heptose 7-phosphate kinase/D-beta-D-heptose 1-phosphate adenosyltransferase
MNTRSFDEELLLTRLPGRRVLVIGDVMLDEYVHGAVRRISPEAPVPVVELHERAFVPGGAANTAANVAGLGAEAVLAGVAGDDEAGRRLREALAAEGVCLDGLFADQARPTTTKTRIVAHGQQMLRIDHERHAPFPEGVQQRLLRFVEERMAGVDGCVLSDYAKGLVSPALARRVIEVAARLGKPVVVDPKGSDYNKYRGATVVKPNLHEASLVVGHDVATNEEVVAAGQRLLDLLAGAAVLLTRGPAGMTLFVHNGEPQHIPAQVREVYDVTGAGDTVAGTLAVALAAGAGLAQAARLASRAAGLTVGRFGTAPVRLDELLGVVRRGQTDRQRQTSTSHDHE